jgi:D-alanyl-D-alanine carboxypeptidase/D-alanyl-D-alanine-endopeptidase (penicillin-binding protein 4)
MDPRQRSRAPARAALAALLGLAATAGACSGDVRGGEPDGPAPEGLRPAAPPAALELPPPERPERDPARERRAAALTERFRARIAAGIEQARSLSKGAAHAGNVRVAISVREVESGAELVALRADEPQRPASNLKLVTTAAALVLFGRGAEFVTPFEACGVLAGGVLAGDLVVRGGGDPLFDPSGRGRVEERLEALGRDLVRAGLSEVSGDLVLDEGDFAEPGPGPGWPNTSQHWAEYCARSGAFSANGGVLRAELRAGRAGQPAALAVHPAPHGLKSSYGVRTIAGTAVDVRVGATASTVTVQGTLGEGIGEYAAEFAHPDPVAHFGSVLRAALERSGITIRGSVRRTRGHPAGTPLAALESPLAELLPGINAESRNGVADQLFLALGHSIAGEGTRAGGARAIGLALERLALAGSGIVQVDGSGLSRENRISARAITALLARVLGSDPETARLYRASLAVAGEKGTLESRLTGTAAAGRVFAKTGWIAGTSALSGLTEPEDLPACVFSILIEYPPELGGLNNGCFKPLQDDLVLLLFEADP